MLRDYAQVAGGTRRRRHGTSQASRWCTRRASIVNGEGGWTRSEAPAFSRELRTLRDDNSTVRAVVLRVNSPGGSVTASEEIQRELVLLNRDKPVVVSMGTLAASGGYWIATAARRVYAQPSTLTGSIGVFAIFPNLEGIAEKNGITVDTVTTGPLRRRVLDRAPEDAGRTGTRAARHRCGVRGVPSRVASARALPMDSVRAIAEGRVWAGEDAARARPGGRDWAIWRTPSDTRPRWPISTSGYGLLEVPKVKGTAEVFAGLVRRLAAAGRGAPAHAAGFATTAARPWPHRGTTLAPPGCRGRCDAHAHPRTGWPAASR